MAGVWKIFAIVSLLVAMNGYSSSPNTVRLMSFNVRMGCGHDDPFELAKGSLGHLPQCADVIRGVGPDIVGIQEIDRLTDRSGGMDQAAELARLCGLEGTFVKKVDRPGGDYGLAELSKTKPLKVGSVLMKGSLHPRALMICDYGDYVVANTHFPLAEWACTNAAAVVRRSLRNWTVRKPVFLMGDFNSTPDSVTMRSIKEDFVVLTDESVLTWSVKNPARTIDYILVDKAHAANVRMLDRRIVRAPEATDHVALVIDVKMTNTK